MAISNLIAILYHIMTMIQTWKKEQEEVIMQGMLTVLSTSTRPRISTSVMIHWWVRRIQLLLNHCRSSDNFIVLAIPCPHEIGVYVLGASTWADRRREIVQANRCRAAFPRCIYTARGWNGRDIHHLKRSMSLTTIRWLTMSRWENKTTYRRLLDKDTTP